MKSKKFLSVLIGLVLISSIMWAQEEPINIEQEEIIAEPARISYAEGIAFLNFEGAEINMLVLAADELKTEEGRIEVCLNGNYFRLDEYTEVTFAALQEDFMSIRIKSGNVYIRVKDEIEVQAPDKETTLTAGLYRIEVGDKKTNIYSNPMIQDNFDRFNDVREKEVSYSVEKHYLPEELSEYEYQLYGYGNWRYLAPYNYVWFPNVAYGWQPYYYGRWVWYPFYGRTWISYDGPWSWLAFHYGRWQWHSNWGWYWIPTRFWGPGWVYWYGIGNYYGWCPIWYGGYNSYYYRRYGSYYQNSRSKVWTFVHKNQLENRHISKSAISQREVPRKIPQTINTQKLRKNIGITTRNRILRKLPDARQIRNTLKSAIRDTKERKMPPGVTINQSQTRISKKPTGRKTAIKVTSKSKTGTTAKKATAKTSTKKKKKKIKDEYIPRYTSQYSSRYISRNSLSEYPSRRLAVNTPKNYSKKVSSRYSSRYLSRYVPKNYSKNIIPKRSTISLSRYLSRYRSKKYSSRNSSKYVPRFSIKSSVSRSYSISRSLSFSRSSRSIGKIRKK